MFRGIMAFGTKADILISSNTETAATCGDAGLGDPRRTVALPKQAGPPRYKRAQFPCPWLFAGLLLSDMPSFRSRHQLFSEATHWLKKKKVLRCKTWTSRSFTSPFKPAST
jgi:hypothetical protein